MAAFSAVPPTRDRVRALHPGTFEVSRVLGNCQQVVYLRRGGDLLVAWMFRTYLLRLESCPQVEWISLWMTCIKR